MEMKKWKVWWEDNQTEEDALEIDMPHFFCAKIDTGEVMKALSIRQPWAGLIVSGLKDIENRSRRTTYRGPILIHASKTPDKFGYDYCDDVRPRIPTDTDIMRQCGGFIGIASIVGCVTEKDAPSDWFVGPFGWVLSDAKPIDFIPYKGQLGLFNVPESVLEGIKI